MEDLPNEIISHILIYLNGHDLFEFLTVYPNASSLVKDDKNGTIDVSEYYIKNGNLPSVIPNRLMSCSLYIPYTFTITDVSALGNVHTLNLNVVAKNEKNQDLSNNN